MIPKVEVFPLWRVAKETGRTVEELHDLCDAEQIIDCEWRKTPTGGVWWCPLRPIIVGVHDTLSDTIAHDGRLPLWAIAKRDGVKPDALARMCARGLVTGARKVGGYWYIPESTVVSAPRRGRRSPMADLVAPIGQPTNGS